MKYIFLYFSKFVFSQQSQTCNNTNTSTAPKLLHNPAAGTRSLGSAALFRFRYQPSLIEIYILPLPPCLPPSLPSASTTLLAPPWTAPFRFPFPPAIRQIYIRLVLIRVLFVALLERIVQFGFQHSPLLDDLCLQYIHTICS